MDSFFRKAVLFVRLRAIFSNNNNNQNGAGKNAHNEEEEKI